MAGNKQTEQRARRSDDSTPDERDDEDQPQQAADAGNDSPNENGDSAPSMEVIRRAKEHIRELTGHEPEGISGLSKQDRGWRLTVEVLELSRVPASTDVLGSYGVQIDREGRVVGYERTARYYRSQSLGDEG